MLGLEWQSREAGPAHPQSSKPSLLSGGAVERGDLGHPRPSRPWPGRGVPRPRAGLAGQRPRRAGSAEDAGDSRVPRPPVSPPCPAGTLARRRGANTLFLALTGMNALQLQNLATLAAAAAAAQTSATTTNANPLSTTSSALGALTSPGKSPGKRGARGRARPGPGFAALASYEEPGSERACVVVSEDKAEATVPSESPVLARARPSRSCRPRSHHHPERLRLRATLSSPVLPFFKQFRNSLLNPRVSAHPRVTCRPSSTLTCDFKVCVVTTGPCPPPVPGHVPGRVPPSLFSRQCRCLGPKQMPFCFPDQPDAMRLPGYQASFVKKRPPGSSSSPSVRDLAG